MGMDANLLAIGRFDKDLLGYDQLDYSDNCYENLIESTVIVITLFHCNTSMSSKQLADCFDLEPWDFGAHWIPSQSMRWNLDKKAEFLSEMNAFEREEIEFLKLLVDKDFCFIYQPNG